MVWCGDIFVVGSQQEQDNDFFHLDRLQMQHNVTHHWSTMIAFPSAFR